MRGSRGLANPSIASAAYGFSPTTRDGWREPGERPVVGRDEVTPIAGPFIGMRGHIERIREDGLVVVRFDAASPFGAMVSTGVFDVRNLRKADLTRRP